METYITPNAAAGKLKFPGASTNAATSYEKILRYYEEAGPDYEAWSKNFNMHFGYGLWTDLFDREHMLQRMNKEVLSRLRLISGKEEKILDMGCGLAATMRTGTSMYPAKKFTGVTIVPWQIRRANELNEKAGLSSNLEVLQQDYTQMEFEDNSFDAVYALESACHSKGESKEDFIMEMKRVLKSGKSFVVADGFTKNPHIKMNVFTKMCYDTICDNWALPCMAEISAFKASLEKHGFKNVVVEDISWKVGPSALHAPCVIFTFLISKFFKREEFKSQSIRNLKGSLMALVLGLCRSKFGYYIIRGEKE